MNDNMSVEAMIDAVFSWFRGARVGDRFTPKTTVELETGRENVAYARLVPNLPHIRRMTGRGWVEMDGRYAILTAAGRAEMERRGAAIVTQA